MFNSKMIPANLLALALAATSVSANAPEVETNRQGVTFSASLPVSQSTEINGFVKGASAPDGHGSNFQIVVNNVPSDNGPYQYQLSSERVSSAGACPAANTVLNPYTGQPNAACDEDEQSQCAVGALSGKHGSMPGGPFSANYVDLYLSTSKNDKAFFGDGSFMVLDANQNVITCANFSMDEIVSSTTSAGSEATDAPTATSNDPDSTTTPDSTTDTTTTPDAAPRNAALGLGAGIFGLVALLL